MVDLHWIDTPKHTQAETDTHLYRVTYGSFESGQLCIWEFDDDAPYGKRLVYSSDHTSFIRAQRVAEAFK